ncbi:hypothetical protein NIES50_21170 [Aulosira laxa NIES-50]|nr:DUF4011 domain-containing protein [Aulosira sp. FACHB-113]BAZ73552.1 hypothetical protein NIES50_21170 [Aulosira laxa NIES-50]
MRQSASSSQQNLAQKIAKWKAGLADLGKRNPLIKFRQDSPRILEILTEEPDVLFNSLTEEKKSLHFKIVDSEYQDIIQSRKNKALPSEKYPLELITRQIGNEQIKRLNKLRLEARRSFEERGVNSLFLALGTLTWYDKDKPEDALLSPLILVPVELIKEPRRDAYKISVLEEDVVLNPTLVQKLKQTFGIELPEGEAIQTLTYKEIISEIRELLAEQKTWQIKENVFLSLFSYAKAAMVRDIIENEALIFEHPILQAISGDLTNYQSNYREPLPASALDSQVKPERTFQILDADSSQQVVIEAAKAGSSFVVQGPPGTGKSQTIVNMIAELIGNGKSVLLVAEKETALSVVYKRLAECGLDHVCLNLHHSGTTDKRELVNNLSKTIEYIKQIDSAENNHLFFERLVSTRQSLKLYLTSLHTKEKPLEKSPFEIFGELLKKERERVPSINVSFSNFSQWNPSRLQEAKNLLNQLAQFLPFFKREKTTIWAKSSLDSYSFEMELQITEEIEEFQQAIFSVQKINQELQEILQVQPLLNLESLNRCYPALEYIRKAPSNLPENWTGVDISIAQDAFIILQTDVHEIEKNKLSQEAQNLLSRISSFLPFLRGEKTTIWAGSTLKSCSETLELEINNKINKFQQVVSLIQETSQQLQIILKLQPLLNLGDLEACFPALQHILKAPNNLPDNWTGIDISTAQNTFTILQADFQEIEKNKLSQEAQNLLTQISLLLPFLRGEKTTIWSQSTLNYCPEKLELEINNQINEFQQAISLIKITSQQLQIILQLQPLLNLGDVEACFPALQHILKAPDNLPDNWTEIDISIAQNAFTKLKTDVTFLKETEPYLKQKYYPEFFSAELPALANRYQKYSRFWFLRVFNPRYRRDFKLLKKLSIKKGQISHNELKRDLAQAVQIQAARNKLYQINYPARKVFGSLFNPEVSNEAELKEIEQALNWLIGLQKYSLAADSVQHIVNSPSGRRELAELVKKLESLLEDISRGMDFLFLYFNENDIIGQYRPHNQILFTELANFLNIAKSNLPDFRKWLTYKEIYGQLETLGLQDFLNALRDNKPNPIESVQNKLRHIDYQPRQVFGCLFNPEVSSEAELKEIEQALNWLIGLQKYSLAADSVQHIVNSPSGRRELAELVKKLESLLEDISRGMNFLFLYFNENDIIGQYRPHNQILFTELANFLNIAQSNLPDFRKWLTYKEIYGQLESLGLQDFLNALRDNKPNPIESVQNKLSHINYQPRQVFGCLFNPEVSSEAELKEIEQALNWLAGLQKYSLSTDSVQRVIDSPAKRRELAELVKKYESAHNSIRKGLDFLFSHFDEHDITDSYLPRNQITFVELETFLNLAQSELPYFQEWLTYKETYQKIEKLGNDKFLDTLRDNQIEPEKWFPVLEKRIYQICLDAILARKPELKNFNFEVHERQISEFSQLDYNQLDTARKRLKQLHVRRWQNWEKTPLSQAELPNLKREATKKRQHLPIRKLLNNTQKGIPNLVKALKPCWMMSPLSVSQYIDADVVHFDVLIFDEASQLRTEDVVPAIIRSNQVIVIGDKKQLPPTSFFSTAKDSEEDSNDEDDASYESVLDECSNFMFGRMLKWHYRSQDERLIAFSNKHFYDSQLVTFPNPVQNPDLGVWFKHVPDGVYDRGKRTDNRHEAQVVAQLALEHFQRCPEQSLGIIAFSEAQADAIQEQIEILGKEHPELETFCSDNSPQYFLKALENVQGDERDAIILSVGYARDDQGKLFLNFGPLNRQGGERRLNVAVTRAKSKITLVSSILAGDIDLTRSQSKGAKALRDYLEYAASGGERLQGNSYTDKLHFDSPFEEDVYHALVQQGYTIRTQVGCSGYRIDLAVVNNNCPGEFLLGIECDGASYHSSPTARDRDRLRQQVLERLGWKIYRIWSTDWFRNKPNQVRLLIERIKQLDK